MNTNQFAQSETRKPDFARKAMAITSLALGLVIMAQYVFLFIVEVILTGPARVFTDGEYFLISFVDALICIAGIVLGIMGLKSTKRYFAIAGIILCALGLIPVVFIFLS